MNKKPSFAPSDNKKSDDVDNPIDGKLNNRNALSDRKRKSSSADEEQAPMKVDWKKYKRKEEFALGSKEEVMYQ